jgi:hypothetical protein
MDIDAVHPADNHRKVDAANDVCGGNGDCE